MLPRLTRRSMKRIHPGWNMLDLVCPQSGGEWLHTRNSGRCPQQPVSWRNGLRAYWARLFFIFCQTYAMPIFDDFSKWSIPKVLRNFEKSSNMANIWQAWLNLPLTHFLAGPRYPKIRFRVLVPPLDTAGLDDTCCFKEKYGNLINNNQVFFKEVLNYTVIW